MINNAEDYLIRRTYTNYGGRKMSEEKIIETKKNIDFWEREVQKHLKNNDIMQAVGCRLLANNLRESIGEEKR